jgi:hypothetical protein
MTKLILAVRNFANTLKNYSLAFVDFVIQSGASVYGGYSKLSLGMQVKSDINDLHYFDLSAFIWPSPV